MQPSLLQVLADPISGQRLHLVSAETDGKDSIVGGFLASEDGRSWPIIDGIPRFVAVEDKGQKQTAESFGFKWHQTDTYDSPATRKVSTDWVLSRFGFSSVEEMRHFFAARRRILDAGCGSGYTASLWLDPSWRDGTQSEWIGVDISSAIDVARDKLGHIPGTHFVQGDLLKPPFPASFFDAIVSDGVLHHTPSTEQAIIRVASLLSDGGEFLFYVYRKKAPIREFADDYVRSILCKMDPAEAWSALRPLTRLGRTLTDLHTTVKVEEDIPLLGIKAGEHDLQRLIYWHFLKLFWHPELTFEENNNVNFDWYHPTYAHRQTEEQVRSWCEKAGLTITRFNAEESGFTVRARKL